jgi:hypothetical protein
MSRGLANRSRRFYMLVALGLALLSQAVFLVDLGPDVKLQLYGGVLFLAGTVFGYGMTRQ